MDDIKLAMLGSKEAAKRLTDAGWLLPCPLCGEVVDITSLSPRLLRPSCNHTYCIVCWSCNTMFGWDTDYGGQFDTVAEARLAWNTRAPILSSEEMEMLHGKENP